ncbi:hypothetical protein FOZ61_011053 [Perkinsus olseni]|uniref:Uncharacterized protein n=1 Tax=Perkinsus olseni TaxID=32597 RepID=A0A7J6M439_PEROL|nr:hypothetical protein FOZ61_011053 [Perkinsus olseni]KAF4666257.1 hypothetical protein FOL46_003208 [Perkinsus olseni]
MKFVLAVVTTVLVAAAEYCQDICDGHAACADSKYGSYCKGNGVCFGLYHKDDGYCFQPTEQDSCDDYTLEPVACPEPQPTCQDVCNEMPQCRDSKWGSYCKTWQKPQVCFGIIKKNDGTLCFAPTDPHCKGDPFYC